MSHIKAVSTFLPTFLPSFLVALSLAAQVFSFGRTAVADAEDRLDPIAVPAVDLNRYAGLWYDIAHNPNFFQRNCLYSTAEYKVISRTEVSVFNTCHKKGGKTSDIDGVASIVDESESAKLKVKFDFFRRGDYWIVGLDPEYEWAVVSAPEKKSLFILARTAPMKEELLEQILADLRSRGFRTDNLVYDKY